MKFSSSKLRSSGSNFLPTKTLLFFKKQHSRPKTPGQPLIPFLFCDSETENQEVKIIDNGKGERKGLEFESEGSGGEAWEGRRELSENSEEVFDSCNNLFKLSTHKENNSSSNNRYESNHPYSSDSITKIGYTLYEDLNKIDSYLSKYNYILDKYQEENNNPDLINALNISDYIINNN